MVVMSAGKVRGRAASGKMGLGERLTHSYPARKVRRATFRADGAASILARMKLLTCDRIVHFFIAAGFMAIPARAQWSSNAAANFAVGDRVADQVTPKIAADGAGGTWITWFDHASGNYDVYV